jgi:hypothetical protein
MSNVASVLLGQANIMVNKNLARVIGLQEAVMYCELLSKSKYFTEKNQLTEDDYFYNTAEDLLDSTALSRYQQTSCINTLVKIGLIETKLMGLPSKKYFKICDCADKIIEILHQGNLKHTEFQLSRNFKPCIKETSNLAFKKLETNNTNITILNNNNKKDYASSCSEDENNFSFSQETSNLVNKFIKVIYPNYFGIKHPSITQEHFNNSCQIIHDFMLDRSIDVDDIEEMMENFIQDQSFKSSDYSIILFAMPSILEIRMNRLIR